jgi:hypothetical protein
VRVPELLVNVCDSGAPADSTDSHASPAWQVESALEHAVLPTDDDAVDAAVMPALLRMSALAGAEQREKAENHGERQREKAENAALRRALHECYVEMQAVWAMVAGRDSKGGV